MSSKDWDESFIRRFKQSQYSEMVVAMWLLSRGNEVRMPRKHLRKDWSERLNHADEGDLIVNGMRCEVKGHRQKFELGKWEFPRVLLSSKFSYDRMERKPDYYFHIGSDFSCVAVVDANKTRDMWRVVSQKDLERGETFDVYSVDPSVLRWYEIKTPTPS